MQESRHFLEKAQTGNSGIMRVTARKQCADISNTRCSAEGIHHRMRQDISIGVS